GVTGYLVPPKDPEALAERILLLLHNPQVATDLGRAGRKIVQEAFSLEKMTQDYQSLYEGGRRNP
ncbi:MAG: glycosyltransferase, partial [Nitrososphaera sp.]